MSKTAILLGATGLTGSYLLERLLKDPDCSNIIIFGRSSVNVSDPKIEEHLIDMFELEQHGETFKGDVVFCCIGTTKAKTPDTETYRKIDYGIPVTAAKLSKKNGIERFIVVSALGADVDSRIFYNKVKGEMERDVLQQNISNTYILQPSLIGGEREEKRTGERIAKFFAGLFDFLIPKKYKMIHPNNIANAMHYLAKNNFAEKRVSSADLRDLAKKPS
ncbi:NAD(P)H-binding protein [Luteirhabdus pelagi]|uniref:NAD(P)H-binding protein n=1 Tax=Luteirhabdus pelagi TaxID=2792783 RepID=UPI00193A062F|nr:NAD(P)H-binding protein [Luteirhabdus pelagi]MCT8339260.1 NAD(P)H-binding protein [Thermobacterium salinum]